MYCNNIRNINKLKHLLSKVEKIDHYTYLSIEKELIDTNPNLEKHLNDVEMFNTEPTNGNFTLKWWNKRNFWLRQEDRIITIVGRLSTCLVILAFIELVLVSVEKW